MTKESAVNEPNQEDEDDGLSRRNCCRRCLTNYNPLPDNPTRKQRFRYAFMCPIHDQFAAIATVSLMVVLIYGALWTILGKLALPGGTVFSLVIIWIVCSIVGWIFERMRLPSLFGMLLAGFALRNIPVVDIVGKSVKSAWATAIGNTALTIILTRAGLGLDPAALRKYLGGVLRVGFMPCLTEATSVAVAAYLLLGFPLVWGFMLGFILTASSPAVIVPIILILAAKGYGVEKGIPSLAIAQVGISDVVAIAGFATCEGLAFTDGGLVWLILQGPVEVIAGFVYGCIMAMLLWYIPHKHQQVKSTHRYVLMFSAGLLAIFGAHRLHLGGAGSVAVVVLSFIAALRWRKELEPGEQMKESRYFRTSWYLIQPLLFGLIGAKVTPVHLQSPAVGLGIAVLWIGVFFRFIASYLSTLRLGYNVREKIYVAIAGFPKATVQAAIGGAALDTAHEENASKEEIQWATDILTIAVLSIVITAPLGAIAMVVTGPYLMKDTSVTEATDEPASEHPA